MKKGLIGFVLIALLGLFILFITGCKAPSGGEEGATQESGGVTEQPTLTGEITDVDNLDTELNDAELDKTEAYLDELEW